MNASVSIIVGVYNGEKYLAELLDSILSQTSYAWICICVNDGSTDSSLSILECYAKKDSRFKIVSRQNGGVGAARNTGIDAFDSKYIMFADQDDKLLPSAVATALSAIEDSGTDIVRFQSNKHMRKSNAVWERIYRRDAIRDVRFPHITGGEDNAFLWELDLLGLKTTEIPDELYWNRTNNGSFSHAVSPKYIGNVFAGYRSMIAAGRRNHLSTWRLFAKLFSPVFWFSLSIVVKRHSLANLRTLLPELTRLMTFTFFNHKEALHV